LYKLRLKELRTKKGFTQAELAEKADTRQETISHWERGHKDYINLEILYRICKALEVSIEEMIVEEELQAVA